MNLKAIKTLIKKSKVAENELTSQANAIRLQINTINTILKKNEDDLSQEGALASDDVNYLPYFGAYKQSLAEWNLIIEKERDVASKKLEIVESHLKEAFIERRKFETVYESQQDEDRLLQEQNDKKSLDELAIEMFNRNKNPMI
jgi:flagellar biosynthesis chaperone FliJ